MKKNKTKIILIVSVAILLVSLIANFFWFYFIKSEAVKITEINKAIREEQVQHFNSVELKKKIVDLEERNAILNSIFIEKSNVVAFIEKVEGVASNNGLLLEIQNVDVDPVTNGRADNPIELYGLLDMVFRVEGNWNSIMSLLDDIQALPHHINIDSLRLNSANSGTSGEKIWTADFAITGVTN